MKFDWYQTTIRDDPARVLALIGKLGDVTRREDRVGKMYRFTQGFQVLQRGHVVASVAMGGQAEGAAHAWASSEAAVPFSDLVRNEWPDDHLVTRVDACEDFIDSTAYRRLVRAGRKVAKGHGLRFLTVRDPIHPEAGATQYLGGFKSEYQGKIYEKGWEVLARAEKALGRAKLTAKDVTAIHVPNIDRECHPSEWVRLELKARPKEREGRLAAAHASPEQLWGFTQWSQAMAREALELELERFYIRERKETNDDKALRFMCRQYGKVLGRLHGDLGDWACVGLQLGEIMAEIERDRSQ